MMRLYFNAKYPKSVRRMGGTKLLGVARCERMRCRRPADSDNYTSARLALYPSLTVQRADQGLFRSKGQYEQTTSRYDAYEKSH